MHQPPTCTRELSAWRLSRREVSLWMLVIVLALGMTVLVGWWHAATRPETRLSLPAQVAIPAGATAREVAELLEARGIIRNALAFRIYASWQKVDGELKPGVYLFQPGESLSEILHQLVAGRVMEVEFTVPEGYTLKQIAHLLEAKGLVSQEEFWQAAAKPYPYAFLDGVPRQPNYLEGFLFPDTYRVPVGTPAEIIIRRMLDRFQEVYNEVSRQRAPGLELSTLEIVTLASLVEKEAKLDAERPLIAGVFLNRLRRGMRLESCATVEYLLPSPKPVLSYEDLEIDSPYNTYKVSGLPPGPIASPGKPSLLAALNPEPTDYLYFVARPDGSHEFSRTLEEHNAAARRYEVRPQS